MLTFIVNKYHIFSIKCTVCLFIKQGLRVCTYSNMCAYNCKAGSRGIPQITPPPQISPLVITILEIEKTYCYGYNFRISRAAKYNKSKLHSSFDLLSCDSLFLLSAKSLYTQGISQSLLLWCPCTLWCRGRCWSLIIAITFLITNESINGAMVHFYFLPR